MGHFEAVFGAALLDGFGDFGVEFLRGDDVVGAVDFRETLAFDAGFVGLFFGGRGCELVRLFF